MAQVVTPLANRADTPFDAIKAHYASLIESRNRFNMARRFEAYANLDAVDGIDPERYRRLISDIRRRCPVYPVTSIKVQRVEEGHGRHIHDEACNFGKPRDTWPYRECWDNLNDSDFIVTILYGSGMKYEATYGVLNGEFTLWAD